MQFVRSGLLLAVVLAMAAMHLVPGVHAQDDGTPAGATPIAADPLAGRLGGDLQSVLDTYGEPDFTDEGLIRYDAIDLSGLTTVLVVYHDEQEVVTRLALAIRAGRNPSPLGIHPRPGRDCRAGRWGVRNHHQRRQPRR